MAEHSGIDELWEQRRSTAGGDAGHAMGGQQLSEEVAPGSHGQVGPPQVAPGSPLILELIEPPNTHYAKPRWSPEDETYASMTTGVPGVTYDPLLGHAARELAAFYALERQMATSGGLQFILDAAGAPEWDVLRTMLVTSDPGMDAVSERVRNFAPESGSVRIGVGESYPAAPPLRRYVAILVSSSPLRLDPVSRRQATRSTVTISGSLPRSHARLRAVVHRPDGAWDAAEATTKGPRRFELEVDTGLEAGVMSVELIADRATGPHPLAQLEFYVDTPLASRFEGQWPGDESHVVTAQDAEQLAHRLLNDDRARARLPRLPRDKALDRIARGHSRDMRDNDFTGHTSPNTGTLADRFKNAGYGALFRAENIATNHSLHDAQAGLLASLAHRRNILAEDPTRVGIGVAIKPGEDRDTYYVTQVFAKPPRRVNVPAAVATIKRRLAEARQAAGLRAFRWDPNLARVAGETAKSRSPTPKRVLKKAERWARRGAAASVSKVGEVDVLQVPKLATDKRYRRLGVGVYQTKAPAGEVPTVVVVIIAAG